MKLSLSLKRFDDMVKVASGRSKTIKLSADDFQKLVVDHNAAIKRLRDLGVKIEETA